MKTQSITTSTARFAEINKKYILEQKLVYEILGIAHSSPNFYSNSKKLSEIEKVILKWKKHQK